MYMFMKTSWLSYLKNQYISVDNKSVELEWLIKINKTRKKDGEIF